MHGGDFNIHDWEVSEKSKIVKKSENKKEKKERFFFFSFLKYHILLQDLEGR